MELNLGTALSVVISDPFELSQELECQIIDMETFLSGAEVETLLVRTKPSLDWQGREYEYLALRGRQAPGIVDELGLGFSVECSGIGVDQRNRNSTAPWGYDTWRGGLAVRVSAKVS